MVTWPNNPSWHLSPRSRLGCILDITGAGSLIRSVGSNRDEHHRLHTLISPFFKAEMDPDAVPQNRKF